MDATAQAKHAAAASDDIWSRGGAWVLAQFPLSALALYAARIGPPIPGALSRPARWIGAGLFLSGTTLFLAGVGTLGRHLTPFPKPRVDARLVQSGVYGLARHPVYSGAIFGVAGWALLNGRWLGLLAAAALAVFFDAKASVEERWLSAAFPDYAEYRQRVHKLIPFIY